MTMMPLVISSPQQLVVLSRQGNTQSVAGRSRTTIIQKRAIPALLCCKAATSTLTNSSSTATASKVRKVLSTRLDLSEHHVTAILSMQKIQKVITSIPHYDAHLQAFIMLLTMHVGVDKAALTPLVEKYPAWMLGRAPHIGEDIVELRRALAFHFNLFVKTSGDELPEAWRAMLRKRPELLLVAPERAESMLRWWASLVSKAGIEHQDAAAFVHHVLSTRPELLNSRVEDVQQESNKEWACIKERRRVAAAAAVEGGASVEGSKKTGRISKAKFVVAYIALKAGVLEMKELYMFHDLADELKASMAGDGVDDDDAYEAIDEAVKRAVMGGAAIVRF